MTPRKAPEYFDMYKDIEPALKGLGWSNADVANFTDAFMGLYEVSNDSYEYLNPAIDLRSDGKYSNLYVTLAEGREALDRLDGIDPDKSISIYISW